jgi:hypothetical protein
LFAQPRPTDLVTVPCCEACRKTQTLDDEYFIRMIAMRHDVGENPAAAGVVASVHRSFSKPNKLRFNKALVRSIKQIDLQTAAGVYLGLRQRMTWGLYCVVSADHRLAIRHPLGSADL